MSALGNYAGQSLEEAFPEVDPQFVPFGVRVLVQLRRPQSKSKGGILLIEETKSDKAFNEQVSKVHSFGPLAFTNRNTGERWPEGYWAKKGEFVRTPRYGGDRWSVDPGDGGELVTFVMFNDFEIFGRVTGNPLTMKVYLI
jgi:co-chaperonin GroES (HSP10)